MDDRFVEASQMIDYVEYLLDILMFAELEQRVKAVDMLLKDGPSPHWSGGSTSGKGGARPWRRNEPSREVNQPCLV